ncbi:flavin reductase family protein [Clostridium butyricum]|uniref:Flavoredoxin n=1 Tax=Clostridium butyricum TaxID=1492 RepID=A0A6N3F0F1_CLOBU|nr:hypothetical protein [Clostridium butyricum]
MSSFKEIKPLELTNNPFEMIGKDWMLITAKKACKVNTMTASWGGLGVIFNKNVATIYVKKQCYTKEFLDDSDRFSLTIFNDEYIRELSYLGTMSGRDEDKISKVKFNISEENGTPYFNEAEIVLICKKIYSQDLSEECFEYDITHCKNYSENNIHTMYIGEIEKILIKD